MVVRHASMQTQLPPFTATGPKVPTRQAPRAELSDAELDVLLMRAFSDPRILTPAIAASIEDALVKPAPKRKRLGLLQHIALLVR